jgi:PKHD-type hydroxylase
MNQWWQYWESYFTPDACSEIIKLAKRNYPNPNQATIGHGGGGSEVNSDIRRSQVRWLKRSDPDFYELFTEINTLIQMANASAFGFDLAGFREIQFTEYHASEAGKYDWHHDTKWCCTTPMRRKLSLVIQLSSPLDYEGGALELKETTNNCSETPPSDVLAKQGTVIVFPSFLEHRVSTVTSGNRYSLVTWVEGPAFR